MHISTRLLQQACRITLFTRPNCSLCIDAKQVLSKVSNTRPFQYKEVDVMGPDAKPWRDLYEFDTPVIHISKAIEGEEKPELVAKAQKLMHRFTTEEVMAKMNHVDAEAPKST